MNSGLGKSGTRGSRSGSENDNSSSLVDSKRNSMLIPDSNLQPVAEEDNESVNTSFQKSNMSK